jgi:hypothetical protein
MCGITKLACAVLKPWPRPRALPSPFCDALFESPVIISIQDLGVQVFVTIVKIFVTFILGDSALEHRIVQNEEKTSIYRIYL